jgi:hypothetical protein
MTNSKVEVCCGGLPLRNGHCQICGENWEAPVIRDKEFYTNILDIAVF